VYVDSADNVAVEDSCLVVLRSCNLRFRVQGLGCLSLGFRVWGLGFKLSGSLAPPCNFGFRVQSLGFRV
jgi:hypothetical protein